MNNLQDFLLFPVKDEESRKKFLIVCLLGFASFIIPILPTILVMGYAGEIMRRIIVNKEEPHMPEWNWNAVLPLGGKLFGVYFIYGIPAMLPMLMGYLLMFIPAILLDPELNGGGVAPEWAVFGMFGGMALFILGMFCSLILFVVFLPPALGHAAAKDSFAAGFHIREWWQLYKINFGGFLLAIVISGGVYMLLIFAVQLVYMTLILCFLVPFLISAVIGYLNIVAFALFAQAYKDAEEKLAQQPITA